jgi:hypothetical protein
MCCVILTATWVSHLLDIAVIGGYQHLAGGGLYRLL